MRALPNWAPAMGNADLEPAGLPKEKERQATGDSTTMTLVPYGATYLRLTTLPVVAD